MFPPITFESSVTLPVPAETTAASLAPVMVITRLAVEVAPRSSVTVYGMVSTCCCPTASDWYAAFDASKV